VTAAPDLFVLAGPNGAGKSTFCARILAVTGLDVIDADRIAALRWPGAEVAHAYDAARDAAALRERYIAERRSFITETVFSHPSKVSLVRDAVDAGYRVHLRVLIVPVELSVARVRQRVAEGGHDVPVEKIRARHARLWSHVAEAIELASDTRVYDSSGQRGRPFLEVARYQLGAPLGRPIWPDWAPWELVHPGAEGGA
jgi:predicted ABC-type ATPase